jgi:hypothetical protein
MRAASEDSGPFFFWVKFHARAGGRSIAPLPAVRAYAASAALARAGTTVVEFVFRHFAAEGVAMNAEEGSGAGLIAIGAIEDALDKTFFEFADSLVEKDAALDHLQYQTF